VYIAVIVLLVGSWGCFAQLPLTGAGKAATGGGGGYVGPGDIVPGARAWWGLRAYSSATAGNVAVDLRRASDSANCVGIKTLATGGLDVSSGLYCTGGIQTATGFCASTTCSVLKLYDQTGNGNDLVQGIAAKMPVFAFTGNGLTVPNMAFTVAAATELITSSFLPSTPPPYSINAVVNHTAGAIQQNAFQIENAAGSNSAVLGFRSTLNNQAFFYDGVNQPLATVTDGTWNALNGSVAGSVSGTGEIFAVNNSPASSTNSGAITLGGSPSGSIDVGTPTFNGFDGFIAEWGVWPSAFGTSLYNNQHVYYVVF
jgi:hypothetical protein